MRQRLASSLCSRKALFKYGLRHQDRLATIYRKTFLDASFIQSFPTLTHICDGLRCAVEHGCRLATQVGMAKTKMHPLSFGPHPLPSCRLTAAERLAEVAEILALGLTRLRARQSSGLSGERENSCVDFTANQSGGAVETFATENA